MPNDSSPDGDRRSSALETLLADARTDQALERSQQHAHHRDGHMRRLRGPNKRHPRGHSNNTTEHTVRPEEIDPDSTRSR